MQRFESPLKNSDSVSRLTEALSSLKVKEPQGYSEIRIPLKRNQQLEEVATPKFTSKQVSVQQMDDSPVSRMSKLSKKNSRRGSSDFNARNLLDLNAVPADKVYTFRDNIDIDRFATVHPDLKAEFYFVTKRLDQAAQLEMPFYVSKGATLKPTQFEKHEAMQHGIWVLLDTKGS